MTNLSLIKKYSKLLEDFDLALDSKDFKSIERIINDIEEVLISYSNKVEELEDIIDNMNN